MVLATNVADTNSILNVPSVAATAPEPVVVDALESKGELT